MSVWGGLDLGGTKIQAAVVDSHGRVVGESRRPTPTSGGPAVVAGELGGGGGPPRGGGGSGGAAAEGLEGGRRCPCGRKGCLEAYAGRAAMEARARRSAKRGKHTQLFEIMEKRGRTRLTSGVWARALDHGDELALKIVERAVQALGTGVASAVDLLDVEAVGIGGGAGGRVGAGLAAPTPPRD